MSVLCALFGHCRGGYYAGDPGYARQPHSDIWTDGTGRGHVHLYAECARCGKGFHVISFHPPHEWIARAALSQSKDKPGE